ncbi:hypothetical protein [Tsukamurella pseudospumae]|uniref:PASTA domain-containing protein n=1 Tax=Tsukamurella pseudospumae TaxID=239498 RepID=A0A138AUU7_9ACTN|nr:hypothetical protein [Tsukamurella pseudospumae]KXP14204.1 hypothetical protein AXK60_21190 [Tsukamurella pseudospumae]
MIGAALVVAAVAMGAGGCGAPPRAVTPLPAGYPVAQVPIVGTVSKAETIDVGHPMWRVTVDGRDTVAAARALLAAGLAPVAPGVPLDAGRVGAVYRGHGFTVGISANDGDVTYVVSPTPGV